MCPEIVQRAGDTSAGMWTAGYRSTGPATSVQESPKCFFDWSFCGNMIRPSWLAPGLLECGIMIASRRARYGSGVPGRVARRRGRRRGGQALVEFAMAVPILMILIFGIFEFSRHYYVRLSVRQSVSEAARFGATGRVLNDPDTGEAMSRAESIVGIIRNRASAFQLEILDIELDPADAGQPGEVVQIRAQYRFAFGTSNLIRSFAPGVVDFTVSATVRNEPVF